MTRGLSDTQAMAPVRFLTLAPAARVCAMELADEDVHVWGVALETNAEVLQAVRRTLSADERERVDRLVVSEQRAQRAIAYGALRRVLSWYEGCDAQTLQFERTPQGKPVLKTGGGRREPVQFNLTHSYGRALIAVSRGRAVGIDLESVKPDREVAGLAQRFLTSGEQRLIEHADADAKSEMFTRVWVAREAAAKALGTGLQVPLNRHAVESMPDAQVGRMAGPDGDWLIRFLAVDAGWAAAVAARGIDWRVRVCGDDEESIG